MKKIGFLFLLLLFVISCNDENNENPIDGDVYWTELTSENFKYLGVAETGEVMAIEMNDINSMPSKLYYSNENEVDFMLWLDDEGLPSEAYVNGYYLIFKNITETSVDIGIINEVGETEILKGLNYDFRELLHAVNTSNLKSNNVEWGTIIKWSGHALNAGMCIASLTGTVSSFGLLAPVGMLTCSSFLVGIASEAAGALVDNDTFDAALLAYSAYSVSSIGDVLVLTGNTLLLMEHMEVENDEIIENVINELEGNSDFVTYDKFGITELIYEDNSNWEQIVEEIFGSEYRVADWNDLENFYNNGGYLLDLFDSLGLTEHGNSAFVTRDGDHNYSSDRYYYASRHEHNKPSNYLAHDNIDNYLISLGSWYGSRKIMVYKSNSTIQDDELVAYYPFNNNANDESENNYNGTLQGVTSTTDRFGNTNAAYSFDGVNDFIELPDLDLVQPVTISAWIYLSDLSVSCPIYISDYNESYWANYYGINMVAGSGKVSLSIGNGTYPNRSIQSDVILSENKWYHIVGCYDVSGSMYLYVDSKDVTTTESGNTSLTLVDNKGENDEIGRDDYSIGKHYFNGKIDDIRIYNKILKESDIYDLYHEDGWE